MKRTMNRKLHFPTLSEWKSKPGYEGTYKAIPKNWITKFEAKFAESELKQLIRNINWKPMKETKSGRKKVRLFNEKKKKNREVWIRILPINFQLLQLKTPKLIDNSIILRFSGIYIVFFISKWNLNYF